MRLFILFVLVSLTACETYIVNDNAFPVTADVETSPVVSGDDAADDPAIWVHPQNPALSLILGTDKQSGLAVYNLQGELVQFLEQGRLNNVDLRSDITLDGGLSTLAVATNRTDISLDIFEIDASGEVSLRYQQALDLTDPYGVCMFRSTQGIAFVFVNSSDGVYQQYQLNDSMNGELNPVLLGSFVVDSQPEGCTVDDQTATLYFGEEEAGIWRMPADVSRADERVMIAQTGNGQLTADVEGMDVYRHEDGAVYLIASSQGDNSYALFDIADGAEYLGSIRVDTDIISGIDGTQETDGLTVTSTGLGSAYPEGILVVQDGYNENPRENQNFKIISWQKVSSALGLD
jgi:3-phytase